MAGFPVKSKYKNFPETRNDVSTIIKIKNFSRIQFIGLAFILSVLTLNWTSIVLPKLVNRMPLARQNAHVGSILSMVNCFNPIRNTKDLFKIKDEKRLSPSQIWIDLAKLCMLIAAIIAHSSVSAEHFVSLIPMYQLNHLKYYWNEWIMQPLNETGFCGLAVMW